MGTTCMSQRKGYGGVQTGASEWSDGFSCFSTRSCKAVSRKDEKIKDKTLSGQVQADVTTSLHTMDPLS